MSRFHQFIRVALTTSIIAAMIGAAKLSFTEDLASIKTSIFSDNGGLVVQAPTIFFVKDLSTSVVLALQYSLDRVNIPPLRGISGIPLPTDGVSGASRPASSDSSSSNFLKKRNELLGTLSMNSVDFTGYYSVESDYTGRLVSFGLNKEFNQKNTNFALRLGYGWDSIYPTGRDSVHTKTNILGNLTLTQTLSPTAIMRIGVDASYLRGYQVNPYRTVFVNGGYFFETHPQERIRLAGFLKINKYIKPMDAALWLDYRLYGDDWGIISHTVGAKFYQNLSKRLLIRYRYRFYSQSAAYFYRENYPLSQKPTFFSADYKLMPFHSHLFGFKVSYQAPELERWLPFANNPTVDLKYERFFTSETFGANILQIGLSFGF